MNRINELRQKEKTPNNDCNRLDVNNNRIGKL